MNIKAAQQSASSFTSGATIGESHDKIKLSLSMKPEDSVTVMKPAGLPLQMNRSKTDNSNSLQAPAADQSNGGHVESQKTVTLGFVHQQSDNQSRHSGVSQGSSGSGLRLNLNGVNHHYEDSDDYDGEEEEGEYDDEDDQDDSNLNAYRNGIKQPQDARLSVPEGANSAPPDLITQVQRNQEPQVKNHQQQKKIPVRDVDEIDAFAEIKMLGPQPASKVGKKTLVLDLDETLVRSQFEEPEKYDLKLPVFMADKAYQVYVAVRPGTHEFLAEMAKYYELVIFTASLSKYANPLMDILDPEGLCTARLFREHCTYDERVYVKDMSIIGRRIEDVILIDNSPNSYRPQPENAIPILSWYDDQSDTELYKLMPFLVGLSKIPDVRWILRHVHKDHVMNLQLADDMVKQLLKEYEKKDSQQSQSQQHIMSNRPSNFNSSDFDLNDRTSDAELLSIMQQPFRQQNAVNSSATALPVSQQNREQEVKGAIKVTRSHTNDRLAASQNAASVSDLRGKQSLGQLNKADKNGRSVSHINPNQKLTQSNTDQKLPIANDELKNDRSLQKILKKPATADPLDSDARQRFQENLSKITQQKTLNDVAFRNKKTSQLDSSSANDYKKRLQQENNNPAISAAAASAAQQRYRYQGGQGTQGAPMHVDESILASNRTFMNERTDLTQTEISPRGQQTQAADQPSGKIMKINTRVIKLSQEKKSIKSLNIKGHIQTNRQKHIMRSQQQTSEGNACLSVGKQGSVTNSSNSQNYGINVLRQNLIIKQTESLQSRDQLINGGSHGLLTMNSPTSNANGIAFNDRRMTIQTVMSPKGIGGSTPASHGIPPRAVPIPKSQVGGSSGVNLNQNRLGHRSNTNRVTSQLKIDINDDKRCNLEEDDSFEEHKGSSAMIANSAGRNVLTPTGMSTRKSSINATPKSRVIEPGAIFHSRRMTPSSAGGMRGRMGGLWPQNLTANLAASNSNNAMTNQHRHSRSNQISSTEVQNARQTENFEKSIIQIVTNSNTSIQNGSGNGAQPQVSGFNKRRVDSIGSSLLKFS